MQNIVCKNTNSVRPKPNLNEIIFDVKIEVKRILNKMNYFKCYGYISESVKYDVDKILKGKCRLMKGETYTQFVKRR